MKLNGTIKITLAVLGLILTAACQHTSSEECVDCVEPTGTAPWPLYTDMDTDIDKIDPSSRKELQRQINKNNQETIQSGWSGKSDYIAENEYKITQPAVEGRAAPGDSNFPLASKNIGESFGQRLFASSNPPGYPLEDGDSANVEGRKTGLISEETVDLAENQVKDWIVKSGSNLRETLDAWASQEGWNLVWKTSREYPIQASVIFTGRFMEVTSALIRSFTKAAPAPQAKFYGNKVIVVTTFEGENAD